MKGGIPVLTGLGRDVLTGGTPPISRGGPKEVKPNQIRLYPVAAVAQGDPMSGFRLSMIVIILTIITFALALGISR